MNILNTALKFSPNNVACRYHKARLLFDMKRYADALKELQELKVLSPDEANIFFLLGRVYRKLGNHHLALVNFSWATEIDPRGDQNHSTITVSWRIFKDAFTLMRKMCEKICTFS